MLPENRSESVRSSYPVPACGRFVSIEPEEKGIVKIMEKTKLSFLVGKKVEAIPNPELGVQKVKMIEVSGAETDKGYYITVRFQTENGGQFTQNFFQKSIEDHTDRLVNHLLLITEKDIEDIFVVGTEFTADVAYNNKNQIQAYAPRKEKEVIVEEAVTEM